MSIHDSIRAKRESAQKARRIARMLSAAKDRDCLLAFADQLDAEAQALATARESVSRGQIDGNAG
jgi:hypothetical protein